MFLSGTMVGIRPWLLQLLVRDETGGQALTDLADAHTVGVEEIAGRNHVVIAGAIQPVRVRIWIDADTKFVTRIEERFQLRDRPLIVDTRVLDQDSDSGIAAE